MGNTLTRDSLYEIAWRNAKAPRLTKFAEFINTNFPQYEAKMEKWWGSFDRPIAGTRLRHEGKYIECMMLSVYDRQTRRRVFEHNPREAYRRNYDVARWILDQFKKQPA